MIVYKTISEYAYDKQISRNKVYRLLKNGDIVKFFIGKKSYFLDKKETIKILSSEW